MQSTYEESRLLWSSRVKAFKASGLAQAEFCKNNDYKIKQFNYWLRKFRKLDMAPQGNELKWIPVNVTEQKTNDSLLIKIGAAVIEVRPGFNKYLLSDIVET